MSTSATSTIAVASAKPLTELTEQERKVRYKVLRAKRNTDQSEVRGEAGVHYFWACHIGRGADAELLRLETVGYIRVREANAKEVLAGKAVPKIQAAGLREDGTYVRGDVTLYQCPQEDYEFFLLDTEERHEQTMTGIQEEFISNAEMQGSPTFTVDQKKR